jgi:hypothetical protein
MTSHIGKVVAVAAGVPATFNKAGYEALTWVNVANPIVAPIPGWETAAIDVPNLTTGITKADKGASSGRVSEMAFEELLTDAGQEDVREYASPSYVSEVSVRIIEPTGTNTHVYMSGIMMNLAENEATVETYKGFTVSFRQNYSHVRATPPA